MIFLLVANSFYVCQQPQKLKHLRLQLVFDGRAATRVVAGLVLLLHILMFRMLRRRCFDVEKGFHVQSLLRVFLVAFSRDFRDCAGTMIESVNAKEVDLLLSFTTAHAKGLSKTTFANSSPIYHM